MPFDNKFIYHQLVSHDAKSFPIPQMCQAVIQRLESDVWATLVVRKSLMKTAVVALYA